MTRYQVLRAALVRIEDIYLYSLDLWGADAADAYITGLYDTFSDIALGEARSRPIPAEFGEAGFLTRYRSHLVYWLRLDPETIGIVAVLHERMHQTRRFRDDAEN
jgi:plasmid stabilization system protein ParE